MPDYRVELHGDVREVYIVEAGSPEEAMANWATGTLLVQESQGCEPVSAALDE